MTLSIAVGGAVGQVLGDGIIETFENVGQQFADVGFNRYIDATGDRSGGQLQSRYRYKGYTFPSNIGNQSAYNGHYMMINISRTVLGPQTKLPGESILSGQINNNADLNLRFGLIPQLSKNTFFQMVDTTLVLYMPNTMVFSQANQYEDISLTGIGAEKLSNFLSSTLKGAVSSAGALLSTVGKVAGAIINPMTEVLFSNTAQRQFQFEFLFAPESEEETRNLENIIKALRFHAAPELAGGGSSSSIVRNLFWVEPSNFDISFWNKGARNTHIPKINTCVMEAIDVDYAPTGIYSTFSNGYPVSVRLTLRFREKNVIHKVLVNEGY